MRTMIDLAMMLTEPAAQNWIQIMMTGKWDHPQYGEMQITVADLHQFKENFDKKVRGVDLAVDIAHQPDKGAVGWFKELKVDGEKLMALVSWTEEGAELVKDGKYKYFSPEFAFTYKDTESGKTVKDVLLGGGITNRPFLKNMDPIELSEDTSYAVLFAEEDPKDKPDDPDEKQKGQKERAKKFGISAKKGGNLTKPSEYSDVPDDEFADPVNFRYPLSPEYVMAAYRYFSKAKNQEEYSPEERKVLAHRIVAKLPEKNQAEAKKTFQLDGGMSGQAFPGMMPNDGKVPPRKPDDVSAGKFTEPVTHIQQQKPGGGNMEDQVVSLAEHTAALDRIKLLETETRRVKLSEVVNGFMFNEATKKGKILPAQKDAVLELMLSMDETQVAKFTEIVNGLPDAIKFNDETGHGSGGAVKTREQMIEEKAQIKMSENPNLTLKQAILLADAEIPAVIK